MQVAMAYFKAQFRQLLGCSENHHSYATCPRLGFENNTARRILMRGQEDDEEEEEEEEEEEGGGGGG
jgi:hypothetical protein